LKIPAVKNSLLIFIALLLSVSIAAQDTIQPKKKKKKKFLKEVKHKALFEKAEILFMDANYTAALPKYLELEKEYPDENILIYRLGVCYLNKADGLQKALEYLSRLDKERFRKTELCYYLGRALHLNYKFDEAIVEFEKCLTNKFIEQKFKDEAKQFISYCTNAKELMSKPTDAKIINMGETLNTEYSEYAPVVSSDETVMMFTYRGERSQGGRQLLPGLPDPEGDFFEDVFISHKTDSGWSKPEPIEGNINTYGNDATIALSNDGQKLFVFKNPPEDPGQISITYQDSLKWVDPLRLLGDIDSKSWEGSFTISADERRVYFSSERPLGFGGKDIYSAVLMPDGTWGKLENLGLTNNTEYDDDAPFIHPTGDFLVFSSKGHNSMGGYDLFYTSLIGDTVWSEPVNMGYPINTPGDDIYFVLSSDGKRGYYASVRPEGKGLLDLYMVENPLPKTFALLQLKGVALLDGKPTKTELEVRNNQTGVVIATYSSNSVTGKYLVNLGTGKDYNITFKKDTFPQIVKTVKTTGLTVFEDTTINVQFMTDAYRKYYEDSLRKMEIARKDSLQKSRKDSLMDGNAFGKIKFEDFMKTYGGKSFEGLVFKVQVGAYNLPKNFKYKALVPYGKVEKTILEDKITRFTIGELTTLNDIYAMKDKIVTAGIKDAFVTAIYKGKRVYMNQIVDLLSAQK
jgi:hypothetical protein